jgi:DNA-binding MarR family transcriptional regulator
VTTDDSSEQRSDLLDTWQYLLETHALLEDLLGAAIREAFDLAMTEVEVLIRLRNADGNQRPSTQLARQASFTSGGLTKLINRLEARNLVERDSVDGDRRIVLIRLTREGERTASRCGEILTEQLEELLLRAWTPKQLKTIRAALLSHRINLEPQRAERAAQTTQRTPLDTLRANAKRN